MNAWPTLREWIQFSGTLALEVVLLFAVAKLLALRLRSAQARRALWQITVLALLFVTVGELNGVRGWLRWPEKKTPSSVFAASKVVVTFKDAEPDLDLFRESLMAGTSPVQVAPKLTPHPTAWQTPVFWPAWLWALGVGLILLRLGIAQIMAGLIRLNSRRRKVDNTNVLARARRIQNALAQRAASVSLADECGERQRDAGGTLGPCVWLVESSSAVVPFTFGVWRPVIVLPQNFSPNFTPEQQDAVLAHELAHVAGFDSAWRTLSQGVCAVLWWHPLTWVAKRELDHASELVADEASLLVANGPDRLAECLLACAKELRRPALAGWLGMDGGGFRSALGKRVTRLLQLNPQTRLTRPVPWYLRLFTPVVCVALLWLGMAAVMKSGEPRGGAWRASILGSAFAAAAELTETKQVALERAKLLQELHAQGTTYAESRAGKLQKPAATTTNSTTVPNLSELPYFGKFFSNQKSNRGESGLQVGAKQQAIYDKLRSIRLSEWGPIDSLPLSEVIRDLADAARRNDPDHQGVNFILRLDAISDSVRTDPAGLPITPTNEPFDLNAVVVRLGAKLNDLSLEEVLNVLEKIADTKIKYSVEDYCVAISPGGNEPITLQTRFFHMDANDLQRVLQSNPKNATNTVMHDGEGLRTRRDGTNTFLTEVEPTPTIVSPLQDWFQSSGVDLRKPGNAIFYNDRLGMLMIRATPEDLDTIEKAFQPFGIKSSAGVVPRAAPKEEASSPSAGQATAGRVARIKLEPEQEWTRPVNGGINRKPTTQATNTNELQSRFFKVDPNTLEQGLKSISAHDPHGGGKKPVFNPYDTNSVIERVQRFLGAAGVDLSAPGRSLFYNDRVGTVMVRATATELDTVEKAIQLLNITPQQLTIRVKVFEVERKSGDRLGFDWFLGTMVTNATPPGAASVNKTLVGNQSDAIPADLLTSGLRTKSSEAATVTGILTDKQFRETIKALESRGGTDLLSAPEVTTISGRQAQIKVVEIRYIVTDLDVGATDPKNKRPQIAPMAEPFELGPVIDLIPYVLPDGYTIQMTVIPSLKEFLGYDDPLTVKPAIAGAAQANGVTQPMPLPKFRLRKVSTSALVWDGQTMVITAGSTRTMQRDRDASGVITTNYTEKDLIYFITPRLIDPAGNPLHADDEFSERHKTVPRQ